MRPVEGQIDDLVSEAVSYTHLVFYAMGAHVMVMARRKQARHEAAELGYETVDFNDPAKACFETLFLINTRCV